LPAAKQTPVDGLAHGFSESHMEIKAIIEAALFVVQKPLSIAELRHLFGESEEEQPEAAEIRAVLAEIAEDYRSRPLELVEVASGYRLHVRDSLAPWISRLFEERPARYTKAFLETLAIIAYRQPATRGEIEEIRGVAVSSQTLRAMMEREWVHVVGHKEAPGRPALYATTRAFLDHFNLCSLADLPPLQDFIDSIQNEKTESPSAPAEQSAGSIESDDESQETPSETT
jgi:segregation and condensation protein B